MVGTATPAERKARLLQACTRFVAMLTMVRRIQETGMDVVVTDLYHSLRSMSN